MLSPSTTSSTRFIGSRKTSAVGRASFSDASTIYHPFQWRSEAYFQRSNECSHDCRQFRSMTCWEFITFRPRPYGFCACFWCNMKTVCNFCRSENLKSKREAHYYCRIFCSFCSATTWPTNCTLLLLRYTYQIIKKVRAQFQVTRRQQVISGKRISSFETNLWWAIHIIRQQQIEIYRKIYSSVSHSVDIPCFLSVTSAKMLPVSDSGTDRK